MLERDLSFVRVDDPQPVVVHLHLPVQFDLFPVIQHEIGTLCQQTGLRVCSLGGSVKVVPYSQHHEAGHGSRVFVEHGQPSCGTCGGDEFVQRFFRVETVVSFYIFM